MEQKSLFCIDDDKFSEVDDYWMQKLWEWADRYNIPNKNLPRDKNKLLKIRHLDLTMIYFGLNDMHTEQWPKIKESLSSENKNKNILQSLLKKGYLPVEIGKLSQLEKLCINYNSIVSLPDSIVNLQNIKKLCLCNNKYLVLTQDQKLWVSKLENSGAIVEYDENLIYRM